MLEDEGDFAHKLLLALSFKLPPYPKVTLQQVYYRPVKRDDAEPVLFPNIAAEPRFRYTMFHNAFPLGGWGYQNDEFVTHKPEDNLPLGSNSYFEEEIHETLFQGKRVKIEVKHRWAHAVRAPFTKTYFTKLTEVKITGLLDEAIVITDSDAMVYTAQHHNFAYEVLIDTAKDQSLPESVRAALAKANIRFISISKGLLHVDEEEGEQGTWLTTVSEKDKRTVVEELTPCRDFFVRD